MDTQIVISAYSQFRVHASTANPDDARTSDWYYLDAFYTDDVERFVAFIESQFPSYIVDIEYR